MILTKVFKSIKYFLNICLFEFGPYVVENTVSVTSPEAVTPKVYPTPVTQQLTIEFGAPISSKGHLSIMDREGRTIERLTLSQGARYHTIETDRMAPGLYFLVLEWAEGVHTQKIIKQ